MFLDFIKDFFTKKIIKSKISNVNDVAYNHLIKTVGILFDGNNFDKIEELIQEIIKKGIQKTDIHILIFKDKIKKNEIFDFASFSTKDLSWAA